MSEWISVKDRMPKDDETIDGRVPAIDSEGYLITVLLIGNESVGHALIGSDTPVVCWMPLHKPPK